MQTTCVILAAGASQRFAGNKLTYPLADGDTLLDRAVRACTAFPTVVVCSSVLVNRLNSKSITVVLNDEAALGMAYSLQLANRLIEGDRAIAIVVADLLLIESKHVEAIIANAHDADVTFPQRKDGTPGHPVVFSPRARPEIDMLPPGDSLRQLRDSSKLTRRIVPVEEAWPYRDVDRLADLRQ